MQVVVGGPVGANGQEAGGDRAVLLLGMHTDGAITPMLIGWINYSVDLVMGATHSLERS